MINSILLYNFILLSSTIFLYFSEYDKTPIVRKICLIFAFLIVVVPSAIRFEIGADYLSYSNLYEKIVSGDIPEKLELGFTLITQILGNLGLNSEWLFIVFAILIHAFSFAAYPKQRKYIFHFFFMLLMYFESFNILRQMLAVTIAMYALKIYSLDNSYLKFLFKIMLAGLFHKIVVIFLIIPFFINKLSNRIFANFGWLTIALWLLSLVSGVLIINSIVLLLSNISLLDYSSYLQSDRYGRMANLTIAGYVNVIFFLTLYFYPFLFVKQVLLDNKENLLPYILFLLYVLFWLLSFKIVIIYRLQQAFAFGLPFILVIVLNNKKIPYRKLYVLVLAIILLYSFNTRIINSHTDAAITCNSGRLAPYVTIFNKEDSQRSSMIKEQLCY